MNLKRETILFVFMKTKKLKIIGLRVSLKRFILKIKLEKALFIPSTMG